MFTLHSSRLSSSIASV